MTKQVDGSKQTSHTLPENIRESLEELWGPITSAYYCGDFVTQDGGKDVHAPTFAVNKTYYVYVHDAENGWYRYETIIQRQKRQKRFGEDVHKIMADYGFTWELGKIIIREYSINGIDCVNLCNAIQEAKNHISHWNIKEEMLLNTMSLFEIDYYLNVHNCRIYKVLKDYLFAKN